MNEIILEAAERSKGKFREKGFVPGVLYGDGVDTTTSVKFDERKLNKLISMHGPNAKLWITINNSKKYGFIREVQRKPITYMISHIDIQIVSKDREIKLVIPINYKDEGSLKIRQLKLQVYKSDVTVFGKIDLMPDTIEVDVSEMNLGDTITYSQLGLNKDIKSENEDTIFGTIINLRVPALNTDDAEVEADAETTK